MQREILFRGKRIDNGEWVYGYYYNGNLNTPCLIDYSVSRIHHVIEPNTLGQYTGLTDKNGVKIFEHDLLEDNYNDEETLIEGKVEVVFDVKKAEWAIDNSFKQDKSSFTSLVGYFGDELKVIGNIHQNEK